MTNWKQKLEALLEGLHIVDQDKFIEKAEVGDYRKLGEMIYENGGAKSQRIEELEDGMHHIKLLLSLNERFMRS